MVVMVHRQVYNVRSMTSPHMRIGHGYDIHELAANDRPLMLGGVAIEHDLGPVAHSDGDAVLHAVTDAILGAAGEGDIGQLFPDDDPANKGADSRRFLEDAVSRALERGWKVINIDATVVCERPRIAPHREAIRSRLEELLPGAAVNIKGRTHEGLDAIGQGRAVEVHALVLLGKDAS